MILIIDYFLVDFLLIVSLVFFSLALSINSLIKTANPSVNKLIYCLVFSAIFSSLAHFFVALIADLKF